MANSDAALTWTDRDAVTGKFARKVLDYGDCLMRIARQAREGGLDKSDWDELAAMLDTDKFRRTGHDMGVMDWDIYRNLLTMWATSSDFRAEFHRISQAGNHVYMELTEYNHPRGGSETIVRTCTAYEFDEADRLVHLGVYLQGE
ncbi:nuclear transport factor 2 family protein [Novosphingobium album (ex Hu et al. 2023)]|uniref:Nuclear transport factor 2 family protein n=1 Tax=Novosphingobium album (ex Hu et al. 2023) TaxID=2930093 RepID=A0ABT0AWT4_9SPHN|nr:nuclear transport factor 2 family protein [Novosphingobium album (ex Hu et al. 2023)]MCJ2177136.1 hypothetical protein [Novosphingobium album (ex Hu et al. 2023)]